MLKTSTKIQIRFNDVDMAGHVHNGVYLSYFEQARMDFFHQLFKGESWNWKSNGVVLAKNEISYHKPVYLHDHISVHTWVEKIGNSSFKMKYEINRNDSELCTSGSSTLVCFDFVRQEKVPFYEEWRNRLAEF